MVLLSVIILGTAATVVHSTYIGDEHWTIVSEDGLLEHGRTKSDLLTFDHPRTGAFIPNAYVAFWITNDRYGRYEAFGHAYYKNGKLCARFPTRDGGARIVRGGFRILSRNSCYSACRRSCTPPKCPEPSRTICKRSCEANSESFKFISAAEASVHSAVGYLGKYASMVVGWNGGDPWFGTLSFDLETAYGVDNQGQNVQISCRNDPHFYKQCVYILSKGSSYNGAVVQPQPQPQPQVQQQFGSDYQSAIGGGAESSDNNYEVNDKEKYKEVDQANGGGYDKYDEEAEGEDDGDSQLAGFRVGETGYAFDRRGYERYGSFRGGRRSATGFNSMYGRPAKKMRRRRPVVRKIYRREELDGYYR